MKIIFAAVMAMPIQVGFERESFEPACIIYASHMLNEAAPENDRIVLFDGKNWDAWKTRDGQRSEWVLKADERSIEIKPGSGDAVSREEFGDFQLHIEFLCPAPPQDAQGQMRSNSGVYVHGRYEIQVLDSMGLEPANNLCGGIYSIASPLVNAAKPAGEWQSYDMVFRAPRFDDAGKVTEKPRITVLHNEKVIHNNLELPSTTPGGVDREMVARGPILLQDHGDKVRFRNIWVRRLD